MKYFSLFSGIGAFEKALQRLGIDYELVGFSEIDKYAAKSYCAIHNVPESLNFGDITKIDEQALPKDIDLVTYGFPCQDISLAGKQKGLFNEDGTQTRSGLFFEALRIIEATQPRVAIAENVKNLTSNKFSEQFKIVLDSLEQAGYNNYWQVLNAKDYGIPQNRERVFIVSIRKDIDTGLFKFPQGFPLELRLKDMLEDEVDDKYYLSDKMFDYVLDMKGTQKGTAWEGRADNDVLNPKIAHTLSVRGAGGNQRAGVSNFIVDNIDGEIKVSDLKNNIQHSNEFVKPVRLGGLFDTEKSKHQAGSIWDKEAISPTIDTMQGGYRQPCVVVREATKQGYAEAYEGDSVNLEHPNSKTRRGRVGHGVAQTLTTSPQQGVVING